MLRVSQYSTEYLNVTEIGHLDGAGVHLLLTAVEKDIQIVLNASSLAGCADKREKCDPAGDTLYCPVKGSWPATLRVSENIHGRI